MASLNSKLFTFVDIFHYVLFDWVAYRELGID